MTTYGFGKKRAAKDEGAGKLDLTGIDRQPLQVDPAKEEDAIRRGAAMGFVERSATPGSARRRPATAVQKNIFIKGPAETLDWFIEYTNERGHRSYWQALEELRRLVSK